MLTGRTCVLRFPASTEKVIYMRKEVSISGFTTDRRKDRVSPPFESSVLYIYLLLFLVTDSKI